MLQLLVDVEIQSSQSSSKTNKYISFWVPLGGGEESYNTSSRVCQYNPTSFGKKLPEKIVGLAHHLVLCQNVCLDITILLCNFDVFRLDVLDLGQG